MKKAGVFLARMQPVHNAHLYMIKKALEECDIVLVVLGSENKSDTLRNPYSAALREKMLRECFDFTSNEKLEIITLPDWSMEEDSDSNKIWGRYFYYNVVSRLKQKYFNLYYSDDPSILDSWFNDTEVRDYITYRNFERSTLFEGLSATKIRNAFLEDNKYYIEKYCPKSVINRFDELKIYYERVKKNPKDDFSME